LLKRRDSADFKLYVPAGVSIGIVRGFRGPKAKDVLGFSSVQEHLGQETNVLFPCVLIDQLKGSFWCHLNLR
jgi:hypothetical protein